MRSSSGSLQQAFSDSAMQNFVYNGHPARVIFGFGTLAQVADEVRRARPPRDRSFDAATDRSGAPSRRDARRPQRRRISLRRRCIRRSTSPSARLKLLQELRRRLHRRAGRRFDDGARQGDRVAHRSAADRDPDHLCRLGNDADPRRNREWREEDDPQCESAAGSRHLRRRSDDVVAAPLCRRAAA